MRRFERLACEIKDIEYNESNGCTELYRELHYCVGDFLYIAIGYVLGIFGKSEIDVRYMVVLCVLGSMVFFLITKHLVGFYYNKHRAKLELKNDDLRRLKIEPTMESISDEDWKKLWEDS